MARLLTDRDKCAHLLRRFGLGASEAEVSYYLQGTDYAGAVDKLLNYQQLDENFTFDIQQMVDNQGRLAMPAIVGWWTARFLETHRPLQEQMTLFWHNHFATSAEKVKPPVLMYGQNEILRRNATGNFKTLLSEVSKDAAMIYWLDNQTNIKGRPNENFAREVMELFTLGIGHYTEQDIQQAARAFTGWSVGRGREGEDILGLKSPHFTFRERAHDTGDKTIFGRTGNFGGEDVLEMLTSNPQCSIFLTRKLFNWFVYPDPQDQDIADAARVLYDSGYDISKWLRYVMLSDAFLSDKAVRAVYKNPMQFLVSTVRQLGYGELLKQDLGPSPRRNAMLRMLSTSSRSMGMFILNPPDVSGWNIGSGWISSATMVERIAWGDKLFGKSGLHYQAFGLFANDPTPSGLVSKLLSIFDVNLPAQKVDVLNSAAQQSSRGSITAQNANDVAAAVSKLIFATPEFQMC